MNLGANIHLIIKEYFRLIGSHPTEMQIKNVAKSCLDHHFDETLKRYREDAENLIQNFIAFEISRLKSYSKPILVEQKLEDDNFTGIIDFFDGQNIIDWKTGNLTQLGDDERRQGKIYDLLLHHNGYQGNFKIYFVTLANGRVLELPLTTETWLISQANKMFMMVEAGQFPKCKSGLCLWCEVQLNCEMEGVGLFDNLPLLPY